MPGMHSGDAVARRARLVCTRCHGKKIKCDLVQQPDFQPCRNCTVAGTNCQIRPSRRGLGKRRVHLDTSNVNSPAPQSPARAAESPQNRSGCYGSPRVEPSISAAQIPSPHSVASHPTPSGQSSSSHPPSLPGAGSCFGDSGYMQLLSRDLSGENNLQLTPISQQPAVERTDCAISPALQSSFVETYFEHCYTWCPVIDCELLERPVGGWGGSPLLQQALALCGNRINPPLIRQRDSSVYYNRAKELFYSGCETGPLIRIASIMLFFWWSTGAPTSLNMDNAWWWTGIAIRIAQESGLHREPKDPETAGLTRRIWWTLFARDRILSISQGRPAVIDLDYCDIQMVSAQDFPNPSHPKTELFVHWVRLLEISGRNTKQLGKSTQDRADAVLRFSYELIGWIQALPSTLALNIRTRRTVGFDRDTHRLHITYLTSIVLLHLSHSSQRLPRASDAAIIAASCIARLFEDLLSRGTLRFLSGDAGWEIAVALLALLYARRATDLRPSAETDIHTLRTALREMCRMWPSSRMFDAAFDKLLAPNPSFSADTTQKTIDEPTETEIVDTSEPRPDWMEYFPFITGQTSPLVDAVLTRNMSMPLSGLLWPMDINAALQEFLDLPDDQAFGMFNI